MRPEIAIAITTTADQCNERTAAEVSKAVRLVQVDLDAALKAIEVEQELGEAKIAILQQRLEEKQVWYESPVLVATISVVLTAVVVVVARETVIDVR